MSSGGYIYRGRYLSQPRAEIDHGIGGYTNWACRCVTCTQANTDQVRAWRAAKGNKIVDRKGERPCTLPN